MGIRLHLQANLFGTHGCAPVLTECDKELLHRRVPVLFRRQVGILALGIGKESQKREPKSSIVCRVLSQLGSRFLHSTGGRLRQRQLDSGATIFQVRR